MRTTPELNGKVNWIGADQIENKETGTAYYLVRVGVPSSELTRLKGLKIIPGMPVEAFIQTQSRTALSYLLKPLTDQVMRAFRET
jgi:HlyD family secretion protein